MPFAELAGEAAYREDRPAHTLDQIVELVSLGRLVVAVGAGVTERIGDTVVAVPVPDVPATRLVPAWPDDGANAARTLFARAVATDGDDLERAS
ncbi:hypothetical protein [Nonomuraea jiangxiensis]|uniref:LysR substrate binding domain-containing protein n=1 Tax=Nonomuraea jiangxiensis TaxID=633440 RepID=A0A1G9D8T6_9ACTN|nr:hypothetical protein [Nonomuraea jiangxiensis]SDK60144.1 hypothetical protein SAMN05421869_11743 [Nonomuraea jiangxiensis]